MAFSGTKDSKCFVWRPDNPFGLQVPFERDGDAGSRTRYIARQEHAGWSGILHGGVTLSLYDVRAEVRIRDTEGVLATECDAVLYRIASGSDCQKSVTLAEVAR